MKKIYFVDDEPFAIEDFLTRRTILSDGGFEICGMQTNAFTALEEIRACRPDVVLSDLKMPGLTGIELLEHLKDDVYVPLFVIVSAYSDYEDIRKLFLTHGFDYLVKLVSDLGLADLLVRLTERMAAMPPPVQRFTAPRRLDEILIYLHSNSHHNHTTQSVGSRFSLTPGGVCNLFSRHLGTTFSAYVNRLRMGRAEFYLRSTFLSVKEIAKMCGYADTVYFTRIFNKIYGLPPSKYRGARGEIMRGETTGNG